MKKSQKSLEVGLACLAVLALAAGCGAGGEEKAPPPRQATAIDAATAGTISGEVNYQGPPVAPKKVRMSGSECTAMHHELPDDETLLVKNGKLLNAFVYVSKGLENKVFPIPAAPKVIDQKGCVFSPHVLGVQVWQPIEIVNSDSTLHNFHTLPRANSAWNIGFPLPGVKETRRLEKAEVAVPYKCDIHGWMKGYIAAVDHPFYAVTGEDGRFELKGLPPGDYTLEAWHEKLGVETQSVKLGAKESKTISFTFAGK